MSGHQNAITNAKSELDVGLRKAAENASTPVDHMRAALLNAVIENETTNQKFSIRSIVSRAGYGFSTFYKYWKSMPAFLFSCYEFGSRAFLASFESKIENFRGDTPREYFEMLANFAVAMNERLPRTLVTTVILTHLEGRFSKVMTHLPKQVDLICDGFNRHFATKGMEINPEKCARVINMIGIYFYVIRLDQDLDTTRDEQVNLVVELMESCVVARPNKAESNSEDRSE